MKKNNAHVTAQLKKGFREFPSGYESVSGQEVFREFWSIARFQKRIFTFLIVLVVLQGSLVGGSIWLVKTSLDQLFHNKDPKAVFLVIGALFLATVVKSILDFLFNWYKGLSIARIRDRLIIRAFRDLMYNPFSTHINERDRKKYGWVLNDAAKFVDSSFGIFNAWFKQPFTLIGTLCALFIIAPFLTLVGLLLIPLCIPCLLFLKRKTKEFIAERKLLLGLVEEVVSETIRSIRIVKVFGLEEREINKLQSTVNNQRELNQRNAFLIGLMSPVSELLGLMGLTTILLVGSRDILSGAFTTGTFFAFVMSFLNIYRPLKDVSNGLLNYQLALDSGRRLIVLRQAAEKERQRRGTTRVESFEELHIDAVCFSYAKEPADDDHILRDLTLTVHRGETVAIVGATGAGKSTLCDLIFRLYRPHKGDIYINGVPLNRIHSESHKKMFSLCSQESIIFNNTLLENIRVAKPDASVNEVWEVAEAVGLSSYIRSLSSGIDTWVGDRGAHCSGGQRQLIAIARALLQAPQVLVFDEAMSGIDMDTNRIIWDNIRERFPDCTIIMVSHHWHVINTCDRIVGLADGGIVLDAPMDTIDDIYGLFRELKLEDIPLGDEMSAV